MSTIQSISTQYYRLENNSYQKIIILFYLLALSLFLGFPWFEYKWLSVPTTITSHLMHNIIIIISSTPLIYKISSLMLRWIAFKKIIMPEQHMNHTFVSHRPRQIRRCPALQKGLDLIYPTTTTTYPDSDIMFQFQGQWWHCLLCQ